MTKPSSGPWVAIAHIALLLFIFVPILWGLRTSLATSNYDFSIIPQHVTFNNYIGVVQTPAFQEGMLNSLLYCGGTVILLLLIIIPAAYALARLNFRGKFVGRLLLFLPLLPFIALLVPLTAALNRYGMLNHGGSVIVVTAAFQVPFACWLLRNFFQAIPRSLEEAAFLDGCSRLQSLAYIIIPNALTGIVAVSVFSVISTWLSYLVPYALISYPALFSMSQTLLAFQGQYNTDYPSLTAAAIMTLVPPIVFFALFQRWFIAGLFGFSSK